MPRRYIEYPATFSTADTLSAVRIAFQGDVLEASFMAADGKRVEVIFAGVRAFRWDDAYVGEVAPCPDRVYVVEDSEWLVERVGTSTAHRHFLLGFVAQGQFLEVIATRLEAKSA